MCHDCSQKKGGQRPVVPIMSWMPSGFHGAMALLFSRRVGSLGTQGSRSTRASRPSHFETGTGSPFVTSPGFQEFVGSQIHWCLASTVGLARVSAGFQQVAHNFPVAIAPMSWGAVWPKDWRCNFRQLALVYREEMLSPDSHWVDDELVVVIRPYLTDGTQELLQAAHTADAARVVSLLQWPLNPDTQFRDGMKYYWQTCMHFAAQTDGKEVVRRLLEAKADIDKANDQDGHRIRRPELAGNQG